MDRKKKTLLIGLVVLAAIAIFLGFLALQKQAREQDANLVSPEDAAQRYRAAITYQGKSYPLKRNSSAVLLIGTDNFIDDAKQHEGLTYNFNLADFLVVLFFDHKAKTITPIQICRDTMCQAPVTSGETKRMQIALSHTYGSGRADSCKNTRTAVEGLLFDAPIDYYLAFTMDTVPYVNDLLGGITVTLEDDIPALGPGYVKGASVTLRGTDALRFVRYRDSSLLDDNLRRMAHHRLYLTGLADAVRKASAEDKDFAARVYDLLDKYLNTDLTVENMSDLLNNLNEYTILPTVTADGKYQPGEEFPEFIVDEASLWDCVHSVYCT